MWEVRKRLDVGTQMRTLLLIQVRDEQVKSRNASRGKKCRQILKLLMRVELTGFIDLLNKTWERQSIPNF